MSELKATPGEWRLIWEDGKHGVIGASVEGEMSLVCIIGNNNHSDGRESMRKANGYLMAASRDMYEALERATDQLKQEAEYAGGCDHSVGVCICDLYRTIADCDAALKKARGEQETDK